jgi:hypothetical protein
MSISARFKQSEWRMTGFMQVKGFRRMKGFSASRARGCAAAHDGQRLAAGILARVAGNARQGHKASCND